MIRTTTPNEVLTIEEARKVLRVGKDSMYTLVHSGRVAHFKVGRGIRIPRAALDRFLAES